MNIKFSTTSRGMHHVFLLLVTILLFLGLSPGANSAVIDSFTTNQIDLYDKVVDGQGISTFGIFHSSVYTFSGLKK